MKIVVHIKFGSEKQRVIAFGNYRYLIYINRHKEDPESMDELLDLLSKQMGVAPSGISYTGKEGNSYLFRVN